MVIVSPSLLACDFLNMQAEIQSLAVVNDIWLHLDVMDGHFVPNLTFGHPIIQKISQATSLKLDAHLMVTNPDFYLETFKNFSLFNVTFHFEATSDPLKLVEKAKHYFPSVGLSLKPQTSIAVLSENLLRAIDLILVMSVEPGFGGQSFIPATYQKIQELQFLKKQNDYRFVIQVDGGVNHTNAQKLIQLGVNNLVAGNYLFQHAPSDYPKAIFHLGHGSQYETTANSHG